MSDALELTLATALVPLAGIFIFSPLKKYLSERAYWVIGVIVGPVAVLVAVSDAVFYGIPLGLFDVCTVISGTACFSYSLGRIHHTG